MYALSAPSRSAVRTESIATLPPPTTATFLCRLIGVSEFGNSKAFIRLLRVRYSFAL